jgi:signal transduction histidine kinase
MNDSVFKLEKFIREVISYSRNARLEIKAEPIRLHSMVLEILDHISNLEHFDKIKFSLDIDDHTIIHSDETRIKIILNNLISNAVKFQRFEEVDIPKVGISYRGENGMHEIRVWDNGQGIPPEFVDKIFNMFYRANVSSDGSGLGLYILKETVHKLNGEIKVKSEEGAGSEFIISLPKF